MQGEETTVKVTAGQIVVLIRSVGTWPFEERIRLEDITRVTLERSGSYVHWFVEHRLGWTLHFHEGFAGAATVISSLKQFFGFSVPAEIAGPGGEGTVVWSRI